MGVSRAAKIATAYALDAWLGDPGCYPHPVRIMGKAVGLLERRVRRYVATPEEELLAGAWLALSLVGGAYLVTRAILQLPAGDLSEIILLYTAIARRDLARSALEVARALEDGNLDRARASLRALVGRDVDVLDRHGIARAAVESVAENYVDGVLTPLLWAGVGGAPAAMAFKAASTLDSMLGYRETPYLYLGRSSARLDDMLNFVPARISIPLLALASRLAGHDARSVLSVGWRCRLNHPSPNSAHAEAAFAGALELMLGGPCSYHGEWKEHPWIGKGTTKAEPGHVREAVRLLDISSLLALALACLCAWRGKR